MKTLKTFAFAAAALALLASCNKSKEITSDAVVSFSSEVNEFYLEDGPNFDVPIEVKGSNITYPVTIRVTDVADTEEEGYSERNVDYRFVNRDVVVESAEDTPVVTLRIINAKAEYLFTQIEIQTVDAGGKVGEVSKAYVIAVPQLNYVAGLYDVKGTNAKAEEVTEQWEFMVENPYVGFTGLLGEVSTDDNDTWPIIGEGGRSEEYDNLTYMAFPMGMDNYIAAADFGDPIGICYIAPLIWFNGQLFAGNLEMVALDNDNIQFRVPNGAGLTYGLFSYETKSFAGYTYGGRIVFSANENGEVVITRSEDEPEAQAAAAALKAGQGEVILTNSETGEKISTHMSVIKTERKSLKK